MNTVHTISIVVGVIALIFGIVASIVSDSFEDYYPLVFIGTTLAALGIMNKNNTQTPKS
jgi:hypothetical protein